jgi:sarcosine oxidase subunit beta
MSVADSKRINHVADVVVIGGGLHGCSTALQLAQRGVSVIVIEKDYVGRHASGVNAGGLRRLGRALPEVPLSVASAKMWQHIEDLVDDDCDFTPSCQIKVAETEIHLEQLRQRSDQVMQLGFNHEQIIDRDTLRELMPSVTPHCVGGMMVEGDGYANPFRTVQAFKRKCEKLGVHFHQGVAVQKITRQANIWRIHTGTSVFESPLLANCAGAWGGKIAAMLGETVPIEARAPMLMITARMPPFVQPVVGTQGRPLSFKQFKNGTVLIGGGHEGVAYPETNVTKLNYAGIAISAQTAVSIFPIMSNARIVRSWAGIEGFMPDKIPVIGPSANEGAFHAFGFSAHGFQLGPIGGKILSELILEGHSSLSIDSFKIDRFNAATTG